MGWYERRVFNPVLDHMLDREPVHTERKKTLASATGRILEVGAGTGLNFPWYPESVDKVTTATRESELPGKALERARAAGIEIEHVEVDGRKFPFEDESFDTVVTTLLLCSVDDPHAVAREMGRVLTPEGRLLVLEHVKSPRAFERAVQIVYGPLHRFWSCGCNLSRDTGQMLADVGFEWTDYAYYRSVGLGFPASQVIRGAARKPR